MTKKPLRVPGIDERADLVVQAFELSDKLNAVLAELEIAHAIMIGRTVRDRIEVHCKNYGSASDLIAFADTMAQEAAQADVLDNCGCTHCKLEHAYAVELAKEMAGHRTLVHGTDHLTKN